METLLQFWGKAGPADANGVSHHPLVYHALDVAAVGRTILSRNRNLGIALSRLMGLDPRSFEAIATWLLAIHDLGKFSRTFQSKVPNFYPACLGPYPGVRPGPRHDSAAWYALNHWLAGTRAAPVFDMAEKLDPLLGAVFAHHGCPVEMATVANPGEARRVFGSGGLCQAGEFLSLTADFFIEGRIATPWSIEQARKASFALAGLAVLCDWIGSNRDWFPYRAADSALGIEDYWRGAALPEAEAAVDKAGILPAAPCSTALSFAALTGAEFAPTRMQVWAASEPLPEPPSLFLIEDATGSGKTEAALMLAHRLIAAGRGAGLYVALPTQATANAMFERMSPVYRRLFKAREKPSLALAHGGRALHPGFRRMLLRAGPPDGADDGEEPADATATAQCAGWIADDRRRVFLADVGVGTIDQALLGVLPSRHQCLRLFGLMRRVLILDEVHAYDAYVSGEIEGLLRFQAAFGGDVVLLSATLSETVRRRLVAAFAEGAGRTAAAMPVEQHYPRATVFTPGEVRTAPVAASAFSRRSVPVRFLTDAEAGCVAVRRAAAKGQAVLYLRNTVDDAIEAAEGLADLDPIVFHARFAFADRLAREEAVLRTFGKSSKSAERYAKVLIATQVVEQSLDLDFDLVVSDLAPIDLLIQRAGRLWRHDRPGRPGRREFLVVTPAPDDDADADWARRAFPKAASVYRDHARLWLTARALARTRAIDTPDGIRPLVEAVYGEDAEAAVPGALRPSMIRALGAAGAARGVAQQNLLKLSAGYSRDGGQWDSDIRTPTRLGEEMVTLRLARRKGVAIVPWAGSGAGHDSMARRWALSELPVRKALIIGEADYPDELARLAAAARRDWSRWDRDAILVVLEEDETSGAWRGAAMAPSGAGPKTVGLCYSRRDGLRIEHATTTRP